MSCPTPQKINIRKGFTLVEVLIVLVIISIMAGLVITVVDPGKQRDRARDANIIATTTKIVAAAQAYYSATGSYPSCFVLTGGGNSANPTELQNVTAGSATCTAAAPASGTFLMNSVVMPNLCDATGYSATAGTSGCKFRYGSSGTAACLGVKLNLENNIDNDTSTGNSWLIWSSSNGAVRDGGPTCAI